MRLIITKCIEKTEVEPFDKIFSLDVLKNAARKTIGGLGKTIKSTLPIQNTQLKKLNLTSKGSAGRAVFLLKINSEDVVLVMLKAKSDKKVGANMTVQNTFFKQLLDKNLDSILQDFENNALTSYEI